MQKGKLITPSPIVNSWKAGFTLMEVLVAFLILSILLGAIYSTFFLSHRAMEGMEESLLKLQECRMAMDILRREGDSVVFSSDNERTVFKMEDRDIYGRQASRFTFTAFSPLIPGLSIISYYVEEEEDGKSTIFKRIHSTSQPNADGRGAEVIEDVEAFLVEARDNDRWVKTWDALETKKIPEEFRITITVFIKERRVSIHETVRPKIRRTI